MCPLMLKGIWSQLGPTSKAREARSLHDVMSFLEDVCEEGSDVEPAFFSGYQFVRSSDGSTIKEILGTEAAVRLTCYPCSVLI